MPRLLEQVSLGRLRAGQLPVQLDVWDLTSSFGEVRQLAFLQKVEWGGCLVWEESRLLLKHPAKGWEYGVSPACYCDKEPDTYAGFAHVHLPDSATGRPYIGFSDLDFRATLESGDKLCLVTNGAEVFALVRTADCTVPPHHVGTDVLAEWSNLYGEALDEAYREMTSDPAAGPVRSDALNRALWRVNRELCRRLGFAFYRGLWGEPLALIFRPSRKGLACE